MISTGLPAPTVAEARRMDLLVEAFCIVCWKWHEVASPCEVHHLTEGGKHGQPRRGHAFTLGLCPWHHRGVPGALRRRTMAGVYGPSYALEAGRFRRLFGDDEALLVIQSQRLAEVAGCYLIRPRYADPVMPGGLV